MLTLVVTPLLAAAQQVVLLFTIPSGSVKTAAREPIFKPVEYTFKRPLGDFRGSSEDGR